MSNLKDRTFGVEIECFLNSDKARFVRNFMNQTENERNGQTINYNPNRYGTWSRTAWTLGYDTSLHSNTHNNAVELTSNPIKFSDLGKIKSVIDELNTVGAGVNKSCGLHVHIDASDLTLKEVKNVLVSYLIYEEVIAFTQPESRRWNQQYCQSSRNVSTNSNDIDLAFNYATTNDLIKKIKKAKSLLKLYQATQGYNNKFMKINLKGLISLNDSNARSLDKTGTIEFRQSAGTTDWEKISNWISFCYMIVETSRFANSGRCSQINLPFARKKRMLFENLRFRLMRAFASKEEYDANFINGVYQNTRKFLVKRITHFTKTTSNESEVNLINRTRIGGDNV